MSQERNVLQEKNIRQACDRALEKPDHLQTALEMIYCEGFHDHVDAEEAAPVFARRAMVMYDELKRQLSACGRDGKAWLEAQKEEAKQNEKDAVLIASGACTLAAAQHKDGDAEYMNELAQRLDTAYEEERISRMLSKYWDAPLQDWFLTWRRYPLLDEKQQRSAACMLAMLSYVEIKGNPAHEMAADVSFDAVCMLSGAVTEMMCRAEKDVQNERASKKRPLDYAQDVAAACGVLCTRYLWLDSVPVCVGCIYSLAKGIKLFHQQLSMLLSGMESTEEGHISWETETGSYDFDKNWEALLRPASEAEGREAKEERRKESEVHRHETDHE